MYFDKKFREQLRQLFLWRRDVRRFCTDPVPDDILKHILRQAMLAPSVGYAQPWRFVSVKSPDKRQKVIANYERSNNEASTIYDTERAKLYRSLKLSGLKDAPIHLAIFSEKDTTTGRGWDGRPCLKRWIILWWLPLKTCGWPPGRTGLVWGGLALLTQKRLNKYYKCLKIGV